MRSRLLIGASGWLLGAAAATCGSMLAVSHLAHGLLGPGTQQVTSAHVRDDLASSQRAAATATASTTQAARRAARPSRQSRPSPSSRPSETTSPGLPAATGGRLLISKGGSVMASCESGGAYLQYWSPAQGFQADDVVRGPAAQARLTFESVTSELVMTVTCQGGRPVDQVSADH